MILLFAIILVFLAVVIINALCVKSPKLDGQRCEIDDKQLMDYSKKLSEMLKCKTVLSREGFDSAPFEEFRKLLGEMFPVLHEKAELKIFGDGCLIYKINGTDSEKNIMLMSHHDVVAASGEWKYPPFEGVIAEKRIWGRGAIDTKTPLFAELMAVEELLTQGFVPSCNIYIGSSHNEEIMGDGIPLAVKYFKENNISFELVIDEGGAVVEKQMPGINVKCAMMAVHEKGRHPLICTATVEFGHFGLSPRKDTPIIRMAKFIEEVDRKSRL